MVLPRGRGSRKLCCTSIVQQPSGSLGHKTKNPDCPSRKWTKKIIAASQQGFYSKKDHGYWVPKASKLQKYIPTAAAKKSTVAEKNVVNKSSYKEILLTPAIQIKPTPENNLLAQKIKHSSYKSRGKVTLSQTKVPLVNRTSDHQIETTVMVDVEESTPFGPDDNKARHLYCVKVERKIKGKRVLVCPITGTASHVDLQRGIKARCVDSMVSIVHDENIAEYERGHVVKRAVERKHTERVCKPVPVIGTFSDRAIRVECDDHTDELASASSVPSIWKPSRIQRAVPLAFSNADDSVVGTKPDWYAPVKTCTHKQYLKVQRVFLDAMNVMRMLRFNIDSKVLRETWVKCWLQVYKKNVAFPGWMITPILSGTVPCAQEFLLPTQRETTGFVTVHQA